MVYFLFWIIQFLAFPALLLYLGYRVVRQPRYVRHLGERFGFLPKASHRTVPGAIWLHAVSVGEVMTATGLLARLRASLPQVPVFVSTTTLAGRDLAKQRLGGLAQGIFYAPIDYRFAVRRVLRFIRPALVIVMETEIWPNLYRESRSSGARLLLVNARISDRALPRYQRWRWFFRAALAWPDCILAQDEQAAARYRAIGARSIEIGGNLKYDFRPSVRDVPSDIAAWLSALNPSHIWIAASTMPPAFDGDVDEDDAVIAGFQKLLPTHPRLLLILVPRRPEQYDAAAGKLRAAGIPFVRRSELHAAPAPELPAVLLLDSIGELSSLFGQATVVFMGGSLPRRGGHNVLEPAAFGVPVVTGPHNENFADIVARLVEGGGLLKIGGPDELAPVIGELLSDAQRRAALGQSAKKLAEAQRGATDRAVATALTLYDRALPAPLHPPLRRLALTPLTWLWAGGVLADRTLRSMQWQPLGAPVVSIGNLAMGGTGKTPFTIWLARELRARGLHPAVLLRGFGRRESTRTSAWAPGSAAPVEETGEEAQLILQAGDAWVGVGADRQIAYWAVQRLTQPDVVLLDDGFQHWPVRRDADLVLIDALDPFRGGLCPLGRLREPFSALRRADAVLITRACPGRDYSGLRQEIARYTPAPVFLVTMQGQLPPLPEGRVGAFCGLGQPEAFRQTLAELGVTPVFLDEFPDHHHYSEDELRGLARRAPVLLTTEKDLANIPASFVSELNIFAVKLEVTVRPAEELLAWLMPRLRARAERVSG